MKTTRVVTTTLAEKPPTFEIVKAEARVDLARMRAITGKLRAEGERVQKLTIDNDEEEQDAARRLAALKLADAEVKAMLAGYKRPFLDVTQGLDKTSKPDRDDLAFVIGAFTSIIGDYNAKKLTARREALAEAQAAARQRDSAAVTASLNERRELAQQSLPGVKVKLKWMAVVTDPELVPRVWCCPDEKSLNAHARGFDENDTPPPIEGVEFNLVGGSTLK